MYALQSNKMMSSDRILVLGTLDGKKPISSTGLEDPRLFTGENKLHAIKDETTNLWHLKYDSGALPPQLKGQSFTSFVALKKHAEAYYNKRNLTIKEIID